MRGSTLLKKTMAVLVLIPLAVAATSNAARAEVRAWEGTITITTYPWEEDINPTFWVLDPGERWYPYTMQDHISRVKTERTYRALFVENEYLKVTSLPELGGRVYSVLDKTTNQQMFYLNHTIKPGMLALRGAWLSGGIEWNSGPRSHTVSTVSPVDGIAGTNSDGSAYLEISNREKVFRTRWTVRVTLHPGRAYLDEQFRLENPTDGIHPYYFWNNTAFPAGPGARFIFPMSLGSNHGRTEYFRWPLHEGRDLTWVKSFPHNQSIFAVECRHDFFGAYDVNADRGLVQAANHREVYGKKAFTWGQTQEALVGQRNLSDDDGPYVEVQSGPLYSQADRGVMVPRDHVVWREFWYPVHGLGDGFEFATKDVAVQTASHDGKLTVRMLATGRFPQSECVFSCDGRELARERVDLGPEQAQTATLAEKPSQPVEIAVLSKKGQVLAKFTTPLPIPKLDPPAVVSESAKKPDADLSAQELYLKGRSFDRDVQRGEARAYYEKALEADAGHALALRSLGVLDLYAGLYPQAIARFKKSLETNGEDGLSWYFLGVCQLQAGDLESALDAAYQTVHSAGTRSLGYDLAGRIHMRQGDRAAAIAAFENAVRANSDDRTATDHLMIAHYAAGHREVASRMAEARRADDPTGLLPRILLAMDTDSALAAEMKSIRSTAGEDDFELIEASWDFARLGLMKEAAQILRVGCVEVVPQPQRSPMAQYCVAWYLSQTGDPNAAQDWLAQAAAASNPFEFASRPEEVAVLRYAVERNPDDAAAQLQLGNLLAHLGRPNEAVPCWEQAVRVDAKRSVAWRNLALAATAKDPAKAEDCYRKAIAARPDDQVLYRDLAKLLIANKRRPEAIELLRTRPVAEIPLVDVDILLARTFLDEERYDEALAVFDTTPYFVRGEGMAATWGIFNRAHIGRGKQRMEQTDYQGALADFEAALTYPEKLNVGRPDDPEEAPAQYWRGKALEALGRLDEARAAWKLGAEGVDKAGAQNEYREKCRELLK